MTEGFSFHQAKPGIEVSVKPRMAQLERVDNENPQDQPATIAACHDLTYGGDH